MADNASSIKWKDLCEAADSTEEDKTEYEFSNGKKFKTTSGGRITGDE